MKKYAVLFSLTGMVEVEAKNAEKAKEIASKMNLKNSVDYDYTINDIEEVVDVI